MRKIRFFSILLCLALLFHICPVNHAVLATSEISTFQQKTEEQYAISYQLTSSYGAITDYDATDWYVFFAYTERSANVDAYDLNGDFAFSLSFENREKGSISLRCQDGLLYVSTKYGNVFIFDGAELVERISSKEAKDQGFHYAWFENKPRQVALRWFRLYILDDSGGKKTVVPIPFAVVVDLISRNIPVAIIVSLLLVGLTRELLNRKRKRKIL